MIDWGRTIDSAWSGLMATSPLEAASVLLGVAYAVLAVMKSRWCWVTGGLSSAIAIYLSLHARLPMQAALQVYYVVVSAYGWWHWTREEETQGVLTVSTWPLKWHVLACGATVVISVVNAFWLARYTQAAWPFLDPLTTWGSLYATWLQARVKLENWLYWIVIDSLLGFLFAAQGLMFFALLSVVYLGFSTVGFIRWLKTYRTPLPAS